MSMWDVAALGLAGMVLVAGCGGTSTSAPSAPKSPSPSITSVAPPGTASKASCKEIDKLRTSLTSLTQTRISASSAGQLTTDIKDIQTELAALKGKAGGAFAGQASSLMASIDQIKKAAGNLDTNPTSAVRQLTTSLVGLKAKAQPVIREMNAACPK